MYKKNTTPFRTVLMRLSFLLLLVAAWQLVFYVGVEWMGWWKSYTIPSPSGVAKELGDFFAGRNNQRLGLAVANSMRRVLLGYAVSIAIGMPLGFLIAKFRYLNENAKPFILGLQTLPSICWVPFAITWYGLGEDAILFIIIVGSTFGIAVAVEGAIQNVEPLYIRAARTMGAKGVGLYLKVVLPASLPELVSGLKQGWSFAWRSLMAGEMMTTSVGLGYVLMVGRELARINQVMVVMLLIVLIGTLVDKCIFEQLENHLRNKMGLNKDKR